MALLTLLSLASGTKSFSVPLIILTHRLTAWSRDVQNGDPGPHAPALAVWALVGTLEGVIAACVGAVLGMRGSLVEAATVTLLGATFAWACWEFRPLARTLGQLGSRETLRRWTMPLRLTQLALLFLIASSFLIHDVLEFQLAQMITGVFLLLPTEFLYRFVARNAR
ncbi:hypothetical protein EXW95_15305 [Deinococcus sp. JMULE3]|nr:hypothetical protein [Deinococcus sp. JMULE3]